MPQKEEHDRAEARLFDRFAEASADVVSRAPFFVACVLLVVVWAPSFWLFPSVDTWQLVINTATTVVTFLMVALLQNSQRCAEQAIHQNSTRSRMAWPTSWSISAEINPASRRISTTCEGGRRREGDGEQARMSQRASSSVVRRTVQ